MIKQYCYFGQSYAIYSLKTSQTHYKIFIHVSLLSSLFSDLPCVLLPISQFGSLLLKPHAWVIILNSFTGSLCLTTSGSSSQFFSWRLTLSFTALPHTPATSSSCSLLCWWCWWESPHHHLQHQAPGHLPYYAAVNTTLLDPSVTVIQCLIQRDNSPDSLTESFQFHLLSNLTFSVSIIGHQ